MNQPKYIFEILQEELRQTHISLLKKIAKKYNINEKEILEFIDIPNEKNKIIPNSRISINVAKKVETRKEAPNNMRCLARIWGRGTGGQCTRKCLTDSNGAKSEYCLQHQNTRKHGRIDETPPKDKFPQKPNSLYK